MSCVVPSAASPMNGGTAFGSSSRAGGGPNSGTAGACAACACAGRDGAIHSSLGSGGGTGPPAGSRHALRTASSASADRPPNRWCVCGGGSARGGSGAGADGAAGGATRKSAYDGVAARSGGCSDRGGGPGGGGGGAGRGGSGAGRRRPSARRARRRGQIVVSSSPSRSGSHCSIAHVQTHSAATCTATAASQTQGGVRFTTRRFAARDVVS